MIFCCASVCDLMQGGYILKKSLSVKALVAALLALFMVLLTACSSSSESSKAESSQTESSKTDESSKEESSDVTSENSPATTETPLEEIHILEKRDYEFKPEGVTTAYGDSHINAHLFNPHSKPEDNTYCLFYLNKQYSTFKGTVVIPTEETYNCKSYLNIYADGKKIYNSGVLERLTKAIEFTIDVKDCEQLALKVGSETGYGDVAVYDAVLIP